MIRVTYHDHSADVSEGLLLTELGFYRGHTKTILFMARYRDSEGHYYDIDETLVNEIVGVKRLTYDCQYAEKGRVYHDSYRDTYTTNELTKLGEDLQIAKVGKGDWFKDDKTKKKGGKHK